MLGWVLQEHCGLAAVLALIVNLFGKGMTFQHHVFKLKIQIGEAKISKALF